MTITKPASTMTSDVLRHMADAMERAEPLSVPSLVEYIGLGETPPACALGSLLIGLAGDVPAARGLMALDAYLDDAIYTALGVGFDDLMIPRPPSMAGYGYVRVLEAIELLYTQGSMRRSDFPAWLRALADDAEREEATP